MELLNHDITSNEFLSAKFLGSADRIISASNSDYGSIQGYFYDYDDNNFSSLRKTSEIIHSGTLINMELCGFPRIGQTMAVGVFTDKAKFSSSLEIINIETAIDKVTLNQIIPSSALRSPFNINCLSYNPSSEILATGLEDGKIVFWDILSGQEMFSIKSDSSNIESIKFISPSQIVSVGASDRSKIKIWDLSSNSFRVLSFKDIDSKPPKLSCFALHPVLSQLSIGSDKGSIFQFDMRNNSSICKKIFNQKGADLILYILLFF